MQIKTVIFLIIGTLLISLAVSGFGDSRFQGRLLIVTNRALDQEAYLITNFVFFVPEDSLALFEEMLVAANATHIGRVPIDEVSFNCYLLNRDNIETPSTEQGNFLCISPALQLDRTDSDEGDLATGKVSEEAEKNGMSFALPEWPALIPEPNLRLSGGGFPFDPPPPSPPFMPGIPAKGFFNLPDWQFDYLLALARISQWLKQWLHNGYPTTSGKSRQFVRATDLSAALDGIKKAHNKSLFRQMPLDASELLAQPPGKGLSGYSQIHQSEKVMLHPVFILPKSASNSFEEAQGVEYVGRTCSICLTNFEESEDVVKTSCSHLFHVDCLKLWLTTEIDERTVNSCPECRHDQGVLHGFLIHKENTVNQERLVSSARIALQEVAQIVTEMQAGRRTWPEDDECTYARLSSAIRSNDPAITEQARALRPLVNFYSVQHLMSQLRAGRGTWPEDDEYIYLRLGSAERRNDPAIALQAQALRPLVNLHSVQHLVSQMQDGRGTWPEDDEYIYLRLRGAERSNDPAIAEQAQALRPLVNLYSVQHLVSEMLAGRRTWPEDNKHIHARLKSAVRCNDPAIAEQAQVLRPLVNFYSVQHLVSQMQDGRGNWPEDDNPVYARLRSAERSNDPAIAEQAQALRTLVNLYSVQHLVSQMQDGRGTWPEDDDPIYARLSSAEHSNDPAIAEQAQALRPSVNLYSVQHLVTQVLARKGTWPEDDNPIYVRLSSAERDNDPAIAEQAQALRPYVSFLHREVSGVTSAGRERNLTRR
ncbi:MULTISPECIES: RING finger domain-containing protein [unclassified Endozoicomonas]|uniref:RING finger protein n=1 Tax=unclassified Endozoicomonas TaxID=2644528 RepID=UPI003BB7CF8C